jgi:citrate synthase
MATLDPAKSGLEGIVAAYTQLSEVDGLKGQLTIRGYDIEQLAGKVCFEEMIHLLWYGHLPTETELNAFNEKLIGYRALPTEAKRAVEQAAQRMEPMDALRYAVGSLTCDDVDPEDDSHEANLERAAKLVARVPVIVGMYQAMRSGKAVVEPRSDLGIAGNMLYQSSGGQEPSPGKVNALDTYLVTVADHGMNASTFTARVITSTASDMVSAVTGAIGALKGPLHGGAPGPALSMIEEIGTPENAEPWMRAAVTSGKRLMGFGHRVYKVRDPRAEVLFKAAERLARETGSTEPLRLAHEVERVGIMVLEDAKPGRNLNTNVEFYTALLLRDIGLPQDLFSPAFGVGRTAGWTAHVMEQKAENRLIRPQSVYVGPQDLKFKPIQER